MDGRRDNRHQHSVSVTVRTGKRAETMATHDVSFNGVFLRTEKPARLRELVFLSLEQQDGTELHLHGVVVRVVPTGIGAGRPAGMGVQFYGLCRSRRAAWENLVSAIAPPPSREALPVLDEPLLDERRLDARVVAPLELRFKAAEELVTMYTRDVSRGGMFIPTTRSFVVGQELALRVILPDGGEAFELDVVVKRTVRDIVGKGIAVEFVRLQERLASFGRFVSSARVSMESVVAPRAVSMGALVLMFALVGCGGDPLDPGDEQGTGGQLLLDGGLPDGADGGVAPSGLTVDNDATGSAMELSWMDGAVVTSTESVAAGTVHLLEAPALTVFDVRLLAPVAYEEAESTDVVGVACGTSSGPALTFIAGGDSLRPTVLRFALPEGQDVVCRGLTMADATFALVVDNAGNTESAVVTVAGAPLSEACSSLTPAGCDVALVSGETTGEWVTVAFPDEHVSVDPQTQLPVVKSFVKARCVRDVDGVEDDVDDLDSAAASFSFVNEGVADYLCRALYESQDGGEYDAFFDEPTPPANQGSDLLPPISSENCSCPEGQLCVGCPNQGLGSPSQAALGSATLGG